MARTGTPTDLPDRISAVLPDRHQEQQAIKGVLNAARECLSGALVLRGEPGAGKTALLEYAVRQSSDLRVVRTAGIESEMELGFASIHQLLLPFLGRLDCRAGHCQRDGSRPGRGP